MRLYESRLPRGYEEGSPPSCRPALEKHMNERCNDLPDGCAMAIGASEWGEEGVPDMKGTYGDR